MKLSCFLLVMLAVLFRPVFVYSDVIYTDEQHEELVETINQLEQLNNDNQMIVEDLQKTNEELQTSYRKQKVLWVVGSILAIVSAGAIGYAVGSHDNR